ncbi:MAG: hypothetical protein KAS32_08625, partial [Candidatus Peribacteraceae bacterium]|nr:hypothetical protein [Candidatus Peribacteraceae bacterium]
TNKDCAVEAEVRIGDNTLCWRCAYAKAKEDLEALKRFHAWQDENRTYTDVERVYATRIDCMGGPERVRRVA